MGAASARRTPASAGSEDTSTTTSPSHNCQSLRSQGMNEFKIYHSRDLRKHRSDTPGGVFGVTKCLRPRLPAINDWIAIEVVSALHFSVRNWGVGVAAFAILLDHFHVLVGLPEHLTLRRWMHRLMSYVGSRTSSSLLSQETRWQKNFHDRAVRSKKQHDFLIDYIHLNPVRKGLVRLPEQWQHSSAQGLDWVSPVVDRG